MKTQTGMAADTFGRVRSGLAAVVCLGLAATNAAAAVAPSDAVVAKAFSNCRSLTDDQARLACYDKASEAFDRAQAEGRVVVVDREQVKAVQRQSFGLSLPSLSILFNRGPKPETLDRIKVELASAHTAVDGKWVLVTLENGVWRQIDTDRLASDPHSGSTVMIRKAMLGSFFCNVDGQSAIRCVRDR